MHGLENPVAARLHGKVDVAGEFGQVGEGVDEVVFVADRVGRGEADALDAVDLVDGFEELDEGAFAVDFGELVAAVEVDDLAEQGDFAHARSARRRHSSTISGIGLPRSRPRV